MEGWRDGQYKRKIEDLQVNGENVTKGTISLGINL
jgi:hypothetical protein